VLQQRASLSVCRLDASRPLTSLAELVKLNIQGCGSIQDSGANQTSDENLRVARVRGLMVMS